MISLRRFSFLYLCHSLAFHLFLLLTYHPSVFHCHFLFCHLSILLSVNLCGMMCSFVSNTIHDVFFPHCAHQGSPAPPLARTPTLFGSVSVFSSTCSSYLEMSQSPSESVHWWFSWRAQSIQLLEQNFDQLSRLVALSKRCSLILLWPIPAITQPIFEDSR